MAALAALAANKLRAAATVLGIFIGVARAIVTVAAALDVGARHDDQVAPFQAAGHLRHVVPIESKLYRSGRGPKSAHGVFQLQILPGDRRHQQPAAVQELEREAAVRDRLGGAGYRRFDPSPGPDDAGMVSSLPDVIAILKATSLPHLHAETGRLPKLLSSVLNRPSQEVRKEMASGERFLTVSVSDQSTGLP